MIVSAIGAAPLLADPARGARDLPSRLLADALAQGLVRFDAAGQIEPGLAERWLVTDGGTSYVFRLREARWSDGTAVEAPQVAERLRRELAPASRNPLRPFLTAIDEIVAMTPQVLEVRLKRPRPDLLKLFAQPELTVLGPRSAAGSGPFAVAGKGPMPLLRPLPDPDRADGDDSASAPERDVRLRGERAAVAVARFGAGRADLVAGGTFTDWPFATNALARTVRVDPAAGLFGLAVVRREGFLADAANREAVAEAIDRGAVLGAVAAGWEPIDRLLPDPLDSAAPPQVPAWSLLTLAERRAAARALVAAWTGGPVRVVIALPAGAGATRLWGQLASSLLAIGIQPVRVAMTSPADLRLVDAVAPYDSARWYLAAACQPCGGEALARINAARDAPTPRERSQRLAEADAALAADRAFIPLARPWRWSLVSPRLRGWQPNARAWHPLNRLRDDTT